MKITLQGIGKRYRANWLFRNFDLELSAPGNYMITGHNGSGKSTMLLIISGYVTPTSGKVNWMKENDVVIPREEVFRYFSVCSPSLQLFEELSLGELVQQHFAFRSMLGEYHADEFKEICGLDAHWNKPVADFSSGMKQRLKIALALMTESEAVLLDEPAMNLDARSVEWYYKMLNKYLGQRLLIVATNNPAVDCPRKIQEINIESRS